MRFIYITAAFVGVVMILLDIFETILLPRRVTHRFRFARFFYRHAWKLWCAIGGRLPLKRVRPAFYGGFGPLSLITLFIIWMCGLILCFAVAHYALQTALVMHDRWTPTFSSYLYLSGTTFFTLGYGDITPLGHFGRALAVVEAGMGFGILAVLISYLPVLYQAFSQREVTISLLDARAGSPPSASQVLLRAARSSDAKVLDEFFAEWERWAAELLESHLSFPVLSYYRSQHDNQSWLAALTTMLDTCAIVLAEVKSINPYRAQLTFAIARHAAVDLALVLKAPPNTSDSGRLSENDRELLRGKLRDAGLQLHEDGNNRLAELRATYEPFVIALADRFQFELPRILVDDGMADNWQRSAWMRPSPGIGSLPVAEVDDDHFR